MGATTSSTAETTANSTNIRRRSFTQRLSLKLNKPIQKRDLSQEKGNNNSNGMNDRGNKLQGIDIISVVSSSDGAEQISTDLSEESNQTNKVLQKSSSLPSNTKPSILKKYSSSGDDRLRSGSSRTISFHDNEKSSSSYKFRFGHRRQQSEFNDGTIRIMLCGGLNSGKTTLVKALKLLYASESLPSSTSTSTLSNTTGNGNGISGILTATAIKERERRVNEIRTTVLKSAVTVIKRRGTQGWSEDAANAAQALLRSSSIIFMGDRVDDLDDISSAPTASTVATTSRDRVATMTRDSDDEEDEDNDDNEDDAIAQIIATEDEVHAQISADAAVAAVLSETELENQAKARAAALIPAPTQTRVPIIKATSIRSYDSVSSQASNNVNSSFNSTVTSDIGRIVYDPKKHSAPIITNNAADALKGSRGTPMNSIEKKKSSTSSPFSLFSKSKSGLSRPSSNESIKEKKTSGSSTISSASSETIQQPSSKQQNTGKQQQIATARESFDGDDQNLPVAEHVMFDAEIVDSLRILYQSEDFQRARMASPSIDAYAGANDLVSHLDTIAASDYQGNDKDYLCAKTKSTENTVCVTELKIQGTPFKIYDVSIEVDMVKDWSNDFDNASAIVYLAALDMYDYPDKEKRTVKGFKKVCKKFKGKPFILLLNKVDLFKEKLRFVPFYMKGMRNEKYKGAKPENAISQQEFDNSVIAVQNFIVAKYQRIWRKKTGGKGSLVIHFTQTTAPDQIDSIFRATRESIVNATSNNTPSDS